MKLYTNKMTKKRKLLNGSQVSVITKHGEQIDGELEGFDGDFDIVQTILMHIKRNGKDYGVSIDADEISVIIEPWVTPPKIDISQVDPFVGTEEH